jgi:predicted PurR-regulated permease PerM
MPLFSPQFKLVMGALALLILALALRTLTAILMPFVAAWMLAYALTPARKRVSRLLGPKVPKAIGAALIEIVFLIAVFSLFSLLAPIVIEELPQLRDQLPTMLLRVEQLLEPVFDAFGIHLTLDMQSLKSLVMNYVDSSWNELLSHALDSLRLGGSIALTVLGNLVLIPLLLFYFLLDQDAIIEKAALWIPPRYRQELTDFFADVDHLLGQYLRGQLAVMLCMACYYSSALSIVGLHLSLPIGMLTGLMLFIPYVGVGTGFVLALMSSLIQFDPAHALFSVGLVYALGQGLEGFFLTPRLVGERIGLHPAMVIFALLVAAQWVGFVGVMIALPVSAVLSVAVRWFKTFYTRSSFFQGDQKAP